MKGTGGLLGTARRRVGAVRQIRRVREIAGILLKYGLGELAAMLLSSPRFRFMGRLLSRKNRERVRKLDRWERIRRALEELGPTFIKLGQILSSRRDLLPRELIRELEKLQDEVPPFDFEQVLEILRRETGRPAEEILPGLDPVPEAAASIAQVHRARLEDGQEVAVKVRRPGIEEQIEVDVQILERVADLAERTLPATRLFNPRRVVQEFKRQIGRELDLSVELLNIEKFRSLMQEREDLYVPRTYGETSSEAVLVMEYVGGRRLGELLDDPGAVEDPEKITTSLADLALEQIFAPGLLSRRPPRREHSGSGGRQNLLPGLRHSGLPERRPAGAAQPPAVQHQQAQRPAAVPDPPGAHHPPGKRRRPGAGDPGRRAAGNLSGPAPAAPEPERDLRGPDRPGRLLPPAAAPERQSDDQDPGGPRGHRPNAPPRVHDDRPDQALRGGLLPPPLRPGAGAGTAVPALSRHRGPGERAPAAHTGGTVPAGGGRDSSEHRLRRSGPPPLRPRRGQQPSRVRTDPRRPPGELLADRSGGNRPQMAWDPGHRAGGLSRGRGHGLRLRDRLGPQERRRERQAPRRAPSPLRAAARAGGGARTPGAVLRAARPGRAESAERAVPFFGTVCA
ncbi:MAG: hypothetical protein JW820_20725 [Spirochaetales bacterium]|nr:hypothetical protein [Spirochaetales bacterium]